MQTDLSEWTDFNVAMTGAAAALVGLMIVAMSVNIEVILKASTLPARAATAIASLTLAIVICGVGLMPSLDTVIYGVVVFIGGLAASVFAVHAARLLLRDTVHSSRARLPKSLVGLVPPASVLAGGSLLMIGNPAGLYAVAAAVIVAIVAGVIFSWVALIEVLR